jgi:hypothetical protein
MEAGVITLQTGLFLYGYIISGASYSSKKTFTYDYPKDLILYFERFKFPQPGHLSLNLDARKINHTFIA